MSKAKFVFVIFLLAISYQLLAIKTFAAADNAITVTPQIARIDLATDQPEAEYLYVNNTKYPVELSFSITDIKELEEGGIPGFLDQNDAANYKYGLSSWATFDKKELLLNPGEKGSVKVIIDKTRLTLGGHYASVLAEIKQKEDGKDVKIKAELASLLFVRGTTGNEREEGKIDFFGALQDLWEFPDRLMLRFQNTGNVDVIPYGLVQIYDVFGHQVAKGIVNEGSLITLPESIRRYTIQSEKLTDFLSPGFYKATISVHFGKSNKTITSQTSFFSQGSIDLRLLAAFFVILIIVVFSLRKKFLNKRKSNSDS